MIDELTGVFTLSAAQLDPLLDTVVANVGVLLPIGLTIMGIWIAIGLIPKIFYRFF